MDSWSLFTTYDQADAYAKNNPVSYPGQILSVIENGNSKVYVIKAGRNYVNTDTIPDGKTTDHENSTTRTLVEVGTGSGGGSGGGSSAEIYWNDEGGIIIGNDTRVTFNNDTWTLITVIGGASKTTFGLGDRTDNATNIEFGTGVISIEDNGFVNNVSLKQMTIPATCTSIGANAFKGCTHLERIDCTAWTDDAPTLNATDPFDGVTRSNVTVVLPTSDSTAFENAGWTGFTFTTPNP